MKLFFLIIIWWIFIIIPLVVFADFMIGGETKKEAITNTVRVMKIIYFVYFLLSMPFIIYFLTK
mgnify:CR=1 FL=1